MVNLAFHQVLFLSTLTRHYSILIVFLCLHHRLIQFLIDDLFFIFVVPLWNSLPSTNLKLLPLSPILSLNSVLLCVVLFFCFWGNPWISTYLLLAYTHMLALVHDNSSVVVCVLDSQPDRLVLNWLVLWIMQLHAFSQRNMWQTKIAWYARGIMIAQKWKIHDEIRMMITMIKIILVSCMSPIHSPCWTGYCSTLTHNFS